MKHIRHTLMTVKLYLRNQKLLKAEQTHWSHPEAQTLQTVNSSYNQYTTHTHVQEEWHK